MAKLRPDLGSPMSIEFSRLPQVLCKQIDPFHQSLVQLCSLLESLVGGPRAEVHLLSTDGVQVAVQGSLMVSYRGSS